MGWISVKEDSSRAKSSNGVDDRKATRVFIAVSDTATSPVAAETASYGGTTIPLRNAGHPDDSTRTVKEINAEPDPESGRKVFTVTVEYSSKSTTESIEDPRSRPARYAWDFDDGTEPYFIDRSDTPKPVVNSAKERFQELLTRETGSIVCTVTKWVSADAYDPAEAVAYKDAVSSDGITVDGVSIDAGQCKMKSLTGDEVQIENGYHVRQIKARLQFKLTWRDEIEDRGFNEKDPAHAGKLREIQKGTPPSKPDMPWGLDGSGAAVAAVTTAPSILEFQPYFEMAFSTFGFA